LPAEIQYVLGNLPSGYHRDLQFVKDRIIPAIDEVALCVGVTQHVVPHIVPNVSIMDDLRYLYIDSVDRVNDLVMQGMPFRDAYRVVGQQIADGTYEPRQTAEPTAAQHLGSVGNPGLDLIRQRIAALY
jgi:argininosuccinate lyase